MHGTEHCNRKRRTFASLLPSSSVSLASGSMLPGLPQPISRPGPVTRNGLSLAHNGSRFRELHSRVDGPDLPLRCLAANWYRPVRPSAPPPIPDRPGVGRFVASGPLQFHSAARLAASPVSTPLRGFCTPPDQSVLPVSLPVGPPSESARFPLAPRCRSFSSMATDHRSWFATFPEACCSSNLLEPHSLCSRSRSPSMLFCGFEPNILRFYLYCF
jgi:hypothetical protein